MTDSQNHRAELLPSLHTLVEKWRNGFTKPFDNDFGMAKSQCADELDALLSRAATTQATRDWMEVAPVVADGVAQAYIVKFDDTDREDIVFFGEFAESAALEYFNKSQLNWSCYLFKCIAGPHPAQPQEREPTAEEWRQAAYEMLDDDPASFVEIENRARELARK